MSKYVVSVFDNEKAAYDGARALGQLDNEGGIAVYEAAVLSKDKGGKIRVLDGLEEAPFTTLGGMMLGSLIGVIGGPVGVLAGATAGSLGGLMVDMNNAGVNDRFLDEVAGELSPGKAALVAEVEEGWTAPLDSRIEALGGTVHRSWRINVEDDQIARDADAADREMQELKEEWKRANEESKAKLKAKMDAAKAKLKGLQDSVQKKMAALKEEAALKVKKLDEQITKADDDFKKKLEKSRADLKADYEQRSQKLKQAGKLVAKAFS